MVEICVQQVDKEEKRIYVFEQGTMVEQYRVDQNQERLMGNIYKGTIREVRKGLGAVFVDIGRSQHAFLPIEEMIDQDQPKTNQTILVQVKKEATPLKGMKVTQKNLNLVGRFLILFPYLDFVTISQKIKKGAERNRLIQTVQKQLPNKMGAVIRTAAKNQPESALQQDLQELLQQWKAMQEETQKSDKNLIYQAKSTFSKLLLDWMDHGLQKVVVDTAENKQEIEKLIQPNNRAIPVEQETYMIEKYDITRQLQSIEKRKIWLKCGGFIIIDQTEALVAIDVNSGKCIGKKEKEEMVYRVNQEATFEIAKQLRLRNLRGIIVIDYIDMDSKTDQEKILRLWEELIQKDRSKVQIYEFTKLNLLEITRKQL